MYERGKKLRKPKTQSKINSIRNPFILKKNKATINSKIKDDKCFQYAVTVALNYGKIESLPERVLNIKPFINKYNWKIINYLPLILCILKKKMSCLYPGYISKINSNCEK